MPLPRSRARFFSSRTVLLGAVSSLLTLSPFLTACGKRQSHGSNPSLRPIEQMIDAQLPAGTTRARVLRYLGTRGHEISPSSEPDTVVAIIHHVDLESLQPVAAQVTFHFDRNDKLASYDLQTLGVPLGRP